MRFDCLQQYDEKLRFSGGKDAVCADNNSNYHIKQRSHKQQLRIHENNYVLEVTEATCN